MIAAQHTSGHASATHSRIVAWVDYRRVRKRVISAHFLHSGLPPVPDLRWCGRMRLPFKGRCKFEKFLREVAKDKDEDATDVESK